MSKIEDLTARVFFFDVEIDSDSNLATSIQRSYQNPVAILEQYTSFNRIIPLGTSHGRKLFACTRQQTHDASKRTDERQKQERLEYGHDGL